jgi:8-oxo-dGTP pyrophosphatase MutT (NUDIX family)
MAAHMSAQGHPADHPVTAQVNQSPAIPAATVILYCESGSAPAKHLMIERASTSAFAAGALVFPGGRIDADDHLLAATDAVQGADLADATERAARIAAIRETIEEVGIALGIAPLPCIDRIKFWRQSLKSGQPLSTLLATADARLDLSVLTPFARWCPNVGNHRRFDTRFYVARVAGEQTVEADGDEVASCHWISAQHAIERAHSGEARIIFPTLRNLERLALYPSFPAVLAHLARTPVRTVTPEVRTEGTAEYLCLPDNAGYPVTRTLLADVVAP